MDDLIKYQKLFSQMVANPSIAESNQESLTEICKAYPWFVLPKVIRLTITKDVRIKSNIVNSISLNMLSNNYYTVQSRKIFTPYIKDYLFLEKADSDETILPTLEEINDGITIFESDICAGDKFPRGRIVVTSSGLFYSEETEGYKIIKEVIAVNQKVDAYGNRITTDRTAEIIEMFLEKKIERITPKVSDVKSDSIDLSVVETDEIVTESMAKIYRMQGLNNEAIGIYNKLSLKYPEKIRYFAEIISSIKMDIEKR